MAALGAVWVEVVSHRHVQEGWVKGNHSAPPRSIPGVGRGRLVSLKHMVTVNGQDFGFLAHRHWCVPNPDQTTGQARVVEWNRKTECKSMWEGRSAQACKKLIIDIAVHQPGYRRLEDMVRYMHTHRPQPNYKHNLFSEMFFFLLYNDFLGCQTLKGHCHGDRWVRGTCLFFFFFFFLTERFTFCHLQCFESLRCLAIRPWNLDDYILFTWASWRLFFFFFSVSKNVLGLWSSD